MKEINPRIFAYSQSTSFFLAFCAKNRIALGGEPHIKEKTTGCVEAINARSAALNRNISTDQELKTLVFETKEGILVAVHIPGDKRIDTKYPLRNDFDRDYRRTIPASYHHLSKITGYTITQLARGFETGTLNPVSLYLKDGKNIKHFFSSALQQERNYYTNTGTRTEGIEFACIGNLIEAIPGSKVVNIRLETSSLSRLKQ